MCPSWSILVVDTVIRAWLARSALVVKIWTVILYCDMIEAQLWSSSHILPKCVSMIMLHRILMNVTRSHQGCINLICYESKSKFSKSSWTPRTPRAK